MVSFLAITLFSLEVSNIKFCKKFLYIYFLCVQRFDARPSNSTNSYEESFWSYPIFIFLSLQSFFSLDFSMRVQKCIISLDGLFYKRKENKQLGWSLLTARSHISSNTLVLRFIPNIFFSSFFSKAFILPFQISRCRQMSELKIVSGLIVWTSEEKKSIQIIWQNEIQMFLRCPL